MLIFNSSPGNGAAAGHCGGGGGYIIRATPARNKESVGWCWWLVLVGISYFILPLSTGCSSRLSVSVVPGCDDDIELQKTFK